VPAELAARKSFGSDSTGRGPNAGLPCHSAVAPTSFSDRLSAHLGHVEGVKVGCGQRSGKAGDRGGPEALHLLSQCDFEQDSGHRILGREGQGGVEDTDGCADLVLVDGDPAEG